MSYRNLRAIELGLMSLRTAKFAVLFLPELSLLMRTTVIWVSAMFYSVS